MKIPVRWTIDEDMVDELKKESISSDRSVSFIANNIFKNKFKIKSIESVRERKSRNGMKLRESLIFIEK